MMMMFARNGIQTFINVSKKNRSAESYEKIMPCHLGLISSQLPFVREVDLFKTLEATSKTTSRM